MPKLPTRQALGPCPTPHAPRRVHSFRAGMAEEAQAKGLREIGKGATQFLDARVRRNNKSCRRLSP